MSKVATDEHCSEPGGKGGDNEPEQGWDKYCRFRPIQFYRFLATEIEARQTNNSKRDYLTDMIRRAVYRVLDRRWAIPAGVLAAVGGIVWFSQGDDVTPADIVIAVFTAVAAFATVLGWLAMNAQNKIMGDQMSQTDAMIEQMRQGQRPWLSARTPSTDPIDDKFDFTRFHAAIPVENSGATPAWLKTGGVGPVFQQGGKDIDADVMAVWAKADEHQRHDAVGPKVTMMFHADIGASDSGQTLTDERRKQIRALIESGDVRFYIVGRWTYRDACQAPHYLECCFVYDSKSKSFLANKKYNDMD